MKKNKYLTAPHLGNHMGNQRGNHLERHSGLRLKIPAGILASVLGAVMLTTAPSHADFIVDSLGSGHNLSETPAADVFGDSLDNLKADSLSDNDLNEANLDYSACGTSPLPSHILDYLETKLDKDAVDTSDWQDDIDAIANCSMDSASWKIGEVNAGADGHGLQDLTASMFDDAIGEGGYTNGVLAADSTKSFLDVADLFPGALSSTSPNSLKTLVAETVVGFDDQNQANDYLNHQDKANYQIAEFKDCYNSTSTISGGAGSCISNFADWNSFAEAADVAAEDFDAAKEKLTLATLNTADLDNIGINYAACGTSPLPSHTLDYLEDTLDSQATEAADWQSDIDAIADCDTDAASWKLAEVNSGSTGHTPQDITADILDTVIGNDGYTSNILAADNSKSIADVTGTFPNALASVTADNVETLISITVTGFETLNQADSYLSHTDRSNYDVTNFRDCYNSESTISGGAGNCAADQGDWDAFAAAEQAEEQNFNDAMTNLNAETLTAADLDNVGLDYSACGVSPLPTHTLDYLETKLDKNADSSSEWQTEIDGLTECSKDAASWKIAEVNSGSTGHTPQDLTADIFDKAVDETGYTNDLLAADSSKSLADVTGAFPNAVTTVTEGSIKSFIAEDIVGFDDVTKAEAYRDNTDKSNYDVESFQDCYDSTLSVVGGATDCSVAHDDWQAVENVTGVAEGTVNAAGVKQSLTGADITAVLSISDETINPAISTADSVHLDYLSDCVSGALDAVGQLIECDSDFTATGVSLFEVGQIVSGATGYSPTGLTTSLLQDTGALTSSSDAAVVSASVCGTSGANSCLAVLRASLDEASFSAEPTAAEVDSWIRDVISDDLRDQATAYTAVSPAATSSCDANVALAVPPACNSSGWGCSTTDSGVTLKDTDANNRYDEAVFANTSTGVGQTVSYDIKQTLDFYSEVFEKTHNYSITLNAVTDHDFQSKVSSQPSLLAMCGSCPTGYRVATRSEAVASGLAEPDFGWWTTDLPDPLKTSGVESRCRMPSAPTSNIAETFCPSGTCGVDMKKVLSSEECKTGDYLDGNKCYLIDQQLSNTSYYCVSNTPTCG